MKKTKILMTEIKELKNGEISVLYQYCQVEYCSRIRNEKRAAQWVLGQ